MWRHEGMLFLHTHTHTFQREKENIYIKRHQQTATATKTTAVCSQWNYTDNRATFMLCRLCSTSVIDGMGISLIRSTDLGCRSHRCHRRLRWTFHRKRRRIKKKISIIGIHVYMFSVWLNRLYHSTVALFCLSNNILCVLEREHFVRERTCSIFISFIYIYIYISVAALFLLMLTITVDIVNCLLVEFF